MQALPLLIRLARRTTDEKQTELGRVAAEQAAAEAQVQAHDAAAERESEAADQDLTALAAYAAWNGKAARERARLIAHQTELERFESAARDALRSAFADQKRLELAREARLRESRLDANRKAEVVAEEQQILARVSLSV
jgi:hypothetical protein